MRCQATVARGQFEMSIFRDPCPRTDVRGYSLGGRIEWLCHRHRPSMLSPWRQLSPEEELVAGVLQS